MKETAYLLQSVLISAWWIGLACSRTFYEAFQFAGIPDMAFWSFLAPDMILIAGLSTIRAYWKNVAVEHVVLGAFGYASLYCWNATLLSGSGFLPTGLMLLGLAYNVFCCFNEKLFRTASLISLPVIAAKTVIQIVCMWFLALVVAPFVILDAFNSLAWPSGGLCLNAGGLLFLCFSGLGLTSAYFMVRDGVGTPLPLDQTRNLVVTGPYQFVRNPMAIAGIGQGVSLALVFQSGPILIYSLLGAIVWHVVVRPIEERDLEKRFGESYLAYRERVACWAPTFFRKAA